MCDILERITKVFRFYQELEQENKPPLLDFDKFT